MKIAYYTDQIYLHGGLERVISNKINYLNNIEEIELYIITFEQKGYNPCYQIPKKVKHFDLSINYNRNISFLHPYNLIKTIKHFFCLKNIIKKIKPDVIVVCNYEYGFAFIPLIAKNKIKILEFHSSKHFRYQDIKRNKSLFNKIKVKVTDYFESKYNYLALLTKDESLYYKSNNKIFIPNAINQLPSLTSSLNSKRVIAAGRIAPIKGFEHLISAWSYVKKEEIDWRLDIFGDGDYEYIETLNNLIKKNNLEHFIKINSATNNLGNEMQKSSIYVMSSLTECFPMVILEAMSYGLPIISFDCPNGPRNIITHNKDGILVEYLNEMELANALIYLIKNEVKRKEMGANAREDVQAFTQNKIMPLWIEVFNKNNQHKLVNETKDNLN